MFFFLIPFLIRINFIKEERILFSYEFLCKIFLNFYTLVCCQVI